MLFPQKVVSVHINPIGLLKQPSKPVMTILSIR